MRHDHKRSTIVLIALLLLPTMLAAQGVGDYNTAASGPWNALSTWLRFNGVDFVPAPSVPTASDGQVVILPGHTVTASTPVSIDELFVATGATLITSGNVFTIQNGPGTDMSVSGTWQLSGATIEGPGTIVLANNGTLNWTSGTLSASSTLNVNAGSTVTANGSATLAALGTINNAGTWNMQGGNLGQPTASGGPCAFNNQTGGIVNLNGWQSNTNSWHQATTNQGTFIKNNGTVEFAFSDDFSGKSFTNAAGGVVNAASGTVVFKCATVNQGSLTTSGTGGFKHNPSPFAPTFTNGPGGTITAPYEHQFSTLILNGPLNLASFTLSGGIVEGPQAITIPGGGQFTWTGGRLDGTTVLNILSGGTAVANGSTTLDALGTINNAGTWNLQGGNVGQSSFAGGPTTFNNLPGGVVNLNGWLTNSNTWHQVTHNQGTFNKNNGGTAFCFSNDFSGKAFHNLAGGVLNVPAGECVFKAPTTNTGSMTGTTNSVFKLDGGPFTNLSGGTVGAPFHLLTGLMHIEGALTLNSFLFTGGTLHGPLALTIGNGGQFTWTGGTLNTTGIITLAAGATGTLNGATLVAQGTINNGGHVTMQSGIITGLGSTPHLFNNLAGGVLDLNGWNTSQAAWHMVTNNAGTINKNNGAETFTFGNDFSGKSFTNLPGGVVNVPSGTLAYALPFPLQNGSFNISNGATLTGSNSFGFAGPAIMNNGSITTPMLSYTGMSGQQLNGTGTILSLAINNTAGVDLGGDQTVINAFHLLNGLLRLGNSDLFIQNSAPAAVNGGGASSWVVNNGSGSLHRQVSGSVYLFPVGTTSYTPLTMSTSGPQDRFSVRVQDGVSTEYGAPGVATGSNINTDVVGRTWVVGEQIAGGNTANITLQWGSAEELASFGRNTCTVARYDGTNWIPGTFNAANGADPFTQSITGLSSFRELAVSDSDADLNGTSTGGVEIAEESHLPRAWPNPAQDVLHIRAGQGADIQAIGLIDIQGRRVSFPLNAPSELVTIDLDRCTPGVYLLETRDLLDRTQHQRVVLAR
ncbi:MAG: hypothetical protein KIT10_13520 [Flavobacteriales bacterium]|nr:hypothetical protein [Flavobacteriales bacterium]